MVCAGVEELACCRYRGDGVRLLGAIFSVVFGLTRWMSSRLADEDKNDTDNDRIAHPSRPIQQQFGRRQRPTGTKLVRREEIR
jgi:hypothetical protein